MYPILDVLISLIVLNSRHFYSIALNKFQLPIISKVTNMVNETERLHNSRFSHSGVRRISCCMVMLNPLC